MIAECNRNQQEAEDLGLCRDVYSRWLLPVEEGRRGCGGTVPPSSRGGRTFVSVRTQLVLGVWCGDEAGFVPAPFFLASALDLVF
jgi:hypothetical protein